MQTTTIQIEAQLESDARQAKAAGIPFNPKLPGNFDDCDNRFRPASHQRWWNRPFIQTYTTTSFGSPVDEEHWMNTGRPAFATTCAALTAAHGTG